LTQDGARFTSLIILPEDYAAQNSNHIPDGTARSIGSLSIKGSAGMARARDERQIKTVDIARGLFIVRYATANDEFLPPKVTLSVDAEQNRNVEFLLPPGARDAVLWQPGTALTVRASATARLLVEVTPARSGGSIAANLKVERLSLGEPTAVSSALPSMTWPVKAAEGGGRRRASILPAARSAITAQTSHDLVGLRVLGHVAGIGDVVAGANEWIAGPSAPSRIEGIAVQWPGKPAQLDLRYSVRLGRPQAAPSPMTELGSFAGTRGHALPLTGIVFELSGAASSDYQLSVEAAFLGSPTMRVIGRRVALSGPTGREPLIGLRVNLEAINVPAAGEAGETGETIEPAARLAPAAAAPAPAPAAPAPAPPMPPAPAPSPVGRSSSRVRVFRSRSKESQPSK
jgi:hypothetical protein